MNLHDAVMHIFAVFESRPNAYVNIIIENFLPISTPYANNPH